MNVAGTLEEGLQDAVHDALWQEPPLEDSVVSATSTDDPLQVVGPANICHMGRMTNVLFEFGSCGGRRDKDLKLSKNSRLTDGCRGVDIKSVNY